ncbi:MAG: DUF975 family protein [Clostridiales bacterium]|nr:DUF975 family protein [Clostridiales bacterium]
MKKAADFRWTARECLRGNWVSAVGTTVLAGLLGASIDVFDSSGSIVFSLFNNGSNHHSSAMSYMVPDSGMALSFAMILSFIAVALVAVAAIIQIARYVIGSFVSLGLAQYNLNLIDGKEVRVGQIFSKTSSIGKAIWLRLRQNIFIFLWSLLLIIPGIIKSLSYSMSVFIIEENQEISAIEWMEVSMRMMAGNKWRLFCLKLSFLGWLLLSVITLGIGLLWVTPYTNASMAAFYDEVSRNNI